ncbi:peptidoglycan recognition protein [Streptomyces sp. Ru71]|uniref:peptidoglycan recognition protein family protein n=1 Tax=Streptomyces sp. Ru71 TaxID=2080746 RepID=UPI0021561BD3|nr:peptidoglycan recognition protein [Streptomyces sp. Ru71]
MRVVRRARRAGRARRGARTPAVARIPGSAPRIPRPAPRIPRPVLAAAACLPGLAAAVALVLCATGVERAVTPTGPGALPLAARPAPHTAPRPRIVPRTVWFGGTRTAQPPPRYDDQVVAVFVHHTDTPNAYDCADTPRIIRDLYTGQTAARDWDDIGYNFLVDRCGTVYEGRAGGVDRPVTGAHTQGFNHRTAGIAAIGTFTGGTSVPRALTDAIAAVVAWKLGPAGVDPRGTARLTSSNGGSRYPRGAAALLPAVAAHRDAYETTCPGAALIARLPAIRAQAARLQGRDGPAARGAG